MRILIIDDEEPLRMMARTYAERSAPGCEVVEAENGEAGLEAASSGKFDVIFTDYNMPKMNGLELARKLIELGNKTPILMLSGNYCAEELAAKLGIAFIPKPYTAQHISDFLSRLK